MSKKLKVVDTTETTGEVADFARKSVDQAQAAFDHKIAPAAPQRLGPVGP